MNRVTKWGRPGGTEMKFWLLLSSAGPAGSCRGVGLPARAQVGDGEGWLEGRDALKEGSKCSSSDKWGASLAPGEGGPVRVEQ